MNLSEPFIRRPVATTLVAIGLALAGILAFNLMPVAPLPEVDFPTISVSATLPGASPTTVATAVATPLERQFGQIAGVAQMTSVSSLGATRINLQFDLNRDIDGAARDVQAAINAARTNLPSDLRGNPTYRKVNPADAPILVMSLTSDSATRGQLYDAASTILQQKLLQTPGVGDVTVGGGALPAVRIDLNPDRLNHYAISLEQVRATLSAANVNLPKGAIEDSKNHYNIGANDMLLQPIDYEPLVVKQENGNIVRISDLGSVHQDVEDLRNSGLSNGKPAVLLIITKQPDANVIATVNRVKAALPFLRASILPTLKLNILMDRTTTIHASLRDVEMTLVLAVLLITGVMFLFFRNWRVTLIPAVVVPLSLLGTFGIIYLLGFSLNNLSLMALTIATGFIADDAIVVVENIMRHLEDKTPPLKAAVEGAREVGFTVLSISISLIAVFIPLLLMGGLVGRLFREFSISLSVAILMSMFISLTVTPMLASLILRDPNVIGKNHVRAQRDPNEATHHDEGDNDHSKSEDYYPNAAIHRFYDKTLSWALAHSGLMGILTVWVILLSIVLYIFVPKGFFPQADTGRLIGSIQAAQSISYSQMQQKFRDINEKVLTNPNVENIGGFVGGGNAINHAFMFITLKPLGIRRDSADQVIAQLRHTLADISGARLYLQSAQDITVGGRQSGAQYQYTLTANSQADLDKWIPQVAAQMRKISILQDINTDQQDQSLQATVNINRDTAARLGVSMDAIDQALYDAFGQRQVSTLYHAANQYHVVMELAPAYWGNPKALEGIYVPTTNKTLVPLSAMANWSIDRTALSVNHQGTFPAVTASFNLAPFAAIGEATTQVEEAVAQLKMPASVVGRFAGTAQVFQQSVANQPLLILAALVSVYIVLGILYENLAHPLTILSTLPSAGVGALIALFLTRTDLSIIALVGVILLIGIVKKNAIMMIDFAITAERHRHCLPEVAIRQACLIRLRPIMMTTATAMLGALPLVIGSGYGSEFRQPLGLSIIGGLLLSQLLTLYTTPVMYLWLDRAARKLRPNARREAPR